MPWALSLARARPSREGHGGKAAESIIISHGIDRVPMSGDPTELIAIVVGLLVGDGLGGACLAFLYAQLKATQDPTHLLWLIPAMLAIVLSVGTFYGLVAVVNWFRR